MSYPNVIYGDYGDEKVTSATKIGSLPLGQLMILPDGRMFRHARASSACAITAGYLQMSSSTISGTGFHKSLTCSADVGATSVVVTCPAGTGAVAGAFEDGYLIVASSTGTGVGRIYKVATNNSAAAAATCTVSLEKTDPIVVAIGGTTATVGLKENQFRNLIVSNAATTYTGPIQGVAPVAFAGTAVGHYFWVQRGGPAPAYVPTTALLEGAPVIAAATAGAFEIAASGLAAGTAFSVKYRDYLGYGMTMATTSGFSIVDLTIE